MNHIAIVNVHLRTCRGNVNIGVYIISLISAVMNFYSCKNHSLLHNYKPRHKKTGFLHICKNKDADQLRGNREADQRLCFHYTDSTIPLLSKSEISSI